MPPSSKQFAKAQTSCRRQSSRRTSETFASRFLHQMRPFFRGILKSNYGSKPPWRTPDHPPYSQMVEIALRALSDEGGSTESSISAYIESTFTDLPWGHDRLLPYYLGKLVVSGEISSPSHDRYQLSLHHHHLLPSPHSLLRRRGGPSLYRPNPSSFPSFKSTHSDSPRRRGRSMGPRPRSRGRRSSGTSVVHMEEGSDAPRRRRGRPPIQRGGEVRRRSVTRSRRSRGSGGVRGRKLWKSGDCDGNSECFELVDVQCSPEKLQAILPPGLNFEQAVQDEGGGKPFVDFTQHEHGEGQGFEGSLLAEHGEGEFSEVREVPLLTLELADVSDENSELRSSQGEALPSVVLEQTELSEEKTLPVERPALLSLENDGHASEMPENDGHGSEISEDDGHGPQKPENSDDDAEKHENDCDSLEKHESKLEKDGSEKLENDVDSPAMPENDDHSLENPEEDHQKGSPDKRTAMVALDQEVFSDEAGSSGGSTKKRKSHGKRRRLKLWFEG